MDGRNIPPNAAAVTKHASACRCNTSFKACAAFHSVSLPQQPRAGARRRVGGPSGRVRGGGFVTPVFFYFRVQRRRSGTHNGSASMTDQTPLMDPRHLLSTSFYAVDFTSSTALAANWDASFRERRQKKILTVFRAPVGSGGDGGGERDGMLIFKRQQ